MASQRGRSLSRIHEGGGQTAPPGDHHARRPPRPATAPPGDHHARRPGEEQSAGRVTQEEKKKSATTALNPRLGGGKVPTVRKKPPARREERERVGEGGSGGWVIQSHQRPRSQDSETERRSYEITHEISRSWVRCSSRPRWNRREEGGGGGG